MVSIWRNHFSSSNRKMLHFIELYDRCRHIYGDKYEIFHFEFQFGQQVRHAIGWPFESQLIKYGQLLMMHALDRLPKKVNYYDHWPKSACTLAHTRSPRSGTSLLHIRNSMNQLAIAMALRNRFEYIYELYLNWINRALVSSEQQWWQSMQTSLTPIANWKCIL